MRHIPSIALLVFVSSTLLAQKQVIRPPGAEPRFPYSFGVIAGDLVYVAGQGSRDPKTGQHPESFEDQVRKSIERIRGVLQAAGMDLSHAASCHVYLDDLNNYQRMNAVYGKLFTENPPVRTTIAMPALPDGNHVEITCIAARDAAAKRAVFRGGKPPARPGLFPAGMRVGDWLFTSGVGSRDPKTGQHPQGFDNQVKQVMETLGETLKAGDMTYADVVWSNLYIDDPANLPALLKVHDGYFSGPRKPARTVSIVSTIPGDSHVEITLLAASPALKPRAVARGAGIQAGNMLFLSAHSAPGRTIEGQVKGTMERLKKSLRAAKMDFANVVKSNVYLKNMDDFPKMNAVYRTYFAKDPPARTTVAVKQAGSSADAMVEISFVATK